MKSVTILSTLMFVFAVFPAHAQQACSEAGQKKADIQIMKAHDRALLDSFYQTNKEMLVKLQGEARDAMNLVIQATVNNSPQIVEWAKSIRDGFGYSVPINERMMSASIMRILPKFLYANWFFQESNLTGQEGKMVPVWVWSEDELRAVEVGYLGNKFYANGLKRMKRSYLVSYEPVIQIKNGRSDLIVNQEFSFYLDTPSLDRQPWEIAVYYAFQTNQTPTELPITQINGGITRKDNYHVEYYTAPLLLDLSTGQIRSLYMPQKDYQHLDPRDPSMGTARVVSDYMQQRWSMERELEKCL